jgi:hypothetical protein
MKRKILKKIIKEELLKEQILCHLVSPIGSGKGGYIPNEEALNLINKIEFGGKKEIKDPYKLKQFNKTIQQFRKDINGTDTNNDTVDTYLHKLRDLIGCYSL